MKITRSQITGALDLAILHPLTTRAQLKQACTLALLNHVKSVCVEPCQVKQATEWHPNVCAVIDFPYGRSREDVRFYEALRAIKDGARELDIVLNYGQILDGNPWETAGGLRLITTIAKQHDILVKAILETCYYDEQKVFDTCKICIEAEVDFVKTSTGVGSCGATIESVSMMLNACRGSKVKVKASGGINSYEDAAIFLAMGCERLGSSKCVELFPKE